MDDPLMLVLRLLHIGFGVLWVGAAWMLFFFVTPTLHALGQQTERGFMAHVLRRRRLATVIMLATIVTVGAGAAMLLIDVNRMGHQLWFGTGFGIGITIGSIAAFLSFLLGPLAIVPLSNRLEKLAAGDAAVTPDGESEFARLGARLRNVLAFDTGLLVVAVVFMATARYL